MKKKLVIITGSPYVGKTTVTENVFRMVDNSAYLDGDWVWNVNPFSIKDPRLRNGDKNMSYTLSTYLKSDFEYVFFSSVIAIDEEIRNNILKDIDHEGHDVIGITLTCSEDTLKSRYEARGDGNRLSFWFLEQPPVQGDTVINTDDMDADQVSKAIYNIITY